MGSWFKKLALGWITTYSHLKKWAGWLGKSPGAEDEVGACQSCWLLMIA